MRKRPPSRVRIEPDTPRDAADAEQFLKAMADVERIVSDPRGRVRARPQVYGRTGQAGTAAPRGVAEADDHSRSGFVAPGVGRRDVRKLKRGADVPEQRLDLHGMTAAEAITAVTRFIDHARHRHRTVCIVHGRGVHSQGQIAVLKVRVRECLRQHPGVLAYADAPREDGGTGAVYVRLRR